MNANSHLKDFYRISPDILKLLAYKSASDNKLSQREADIIEAFYDTVVALITAAELDIHTARLAAASEHVKAVFLQEELKGVYNELYAHFPAHAIDLIAKSYLPTKKELESAVVIG